MTRRCQTCRWFSLTHDYPDEAWGICQCEGCPFCGHEMDAGDCCPSWAEGEGE